MPYGDLPGRNVHIRFPVGKKENIGARDREDSAAISGDLAEELADRDYGSRFSREDIFLHPFKIGSSPNQVSKLEELLDLQTV